MSKGNDANFKSSKADNTLDITGMLIEPNGFKLPPDEPDNTKKPISDKDYRDAWNKLAKARLNIPLIEEPTLPSIEQEIEKIAERLWLAGRESGDIATINEIIPHTDQLLALFHSYSEERVREARIEELKWNLSLYPEDLLEEVNSWKIESEIKDRLAELNQENTKGDKDE